MTPEVRELLVHWASVAIVQATEGVRLLKALEHDEPPHYLTRPVPCPIGTPYGTVLRMRDHGLVVIDPPSEYGWCRVRLASHRGEGP